jgi:hypothetical protein
MSGFLLFWLLAAFFAAGMAVMKFLQWWRDR